MKINFIKYENNCAINFKTIRNKDYYPMKYDDNLKNANILLIPFENFREGYKILFSETTKEFFNYLKEAGDENIKPDVVCLDEDFKEIELHNADIIITSMLISNMVLPFLINLLSSFVYNKLTNIAQEPRSANVKFELYINNSSKSSTTKVKYNGPASEIERTLKQVNKMMNEDK